MASLAIIAVCVAGVIWLSRANWRDNRDAGNGWSYIYWQKWRIWLMGGAAGFMVLFLIFLSVLEPLGL